MPRIPYVFPAPGESVIADAIRTRRRERGLIDLDGMILNAPNIAEGYNALMHSVRSANSLDGGLRELLILRVAVLNSATYEWLAHEAIGRETGLTTAQLLAVRDDSIVPHPGSPALTPLQHVALQYVDYMTREVRVPQAIFDELRSMLADDRQVVEMTMTIAAYNMVSRILVALDVADKADETVPNPE